MGIETIKNDKKNRQEVSQRLWLANEAALKFAVKDIELKGKENIKAIPPGAKVVIMTTHLTDLDVLLAIHAVARDLNVAVMNESVHHNFFGEQGEFTTSLGLRVAGKNSFIPIDFKKTASGAKAPKAFNPENFEPAAKAVEEGKAVLIAAHNPSQKPLQNLDNVRGGYGGVYLSLLTDAYILPVTVVLDRATGMYVPALEKIKKMKEDRPNASVVIGKPFKLEKVPEIKRFGELTKKRKTGSELTDEERTEFSKLADVLREKSEEIISRMSDQITTQN